MEEKRLTLMSASCPFCNKEATFLVEVSEISAGKNGEKLLKYELLAEADSSIIHDSCSCPGTKREIKDVALIIKFIGKIQEEKNETRS
jgi:hypothetical protein